MLANDCLTVFQTIADTLNAPVETAEMLRSVSKSIVENLAVKACQFFLLGRDPKQLENIASFGVSDRFAVSGPLEVKGMVDELLRGDTVYVKDCQSDSGACHLPAHKEEGIKSLLLVPLRSRGQVIGAMHIATAEERAFSADDLEVIGVVATLYY